jgi:hypothetical protein
VLLVEVDIDVVLEVVVGRPVGIEMPLGSENGFAGVVVGRPVGIVRPLEGRTSLASSLLR